MGERLRASGRTESTGQLGPLSLAPDPSSHWPSTPKLSLQPWAQQGHPAPPTPLQGRGPWGEEGPGGVPGQAGGSAGKG